MKQRGCILGRIGILSWLIIIFLIITVPTRLIFGQWLWQPGFLDNAKTRLGLGPKPVVAASPTALPQATLVVVKPTDTPKPKPTNTPKPAVVSATNTPVPVATDTPVSLPAATHTAVIVPQQLPVVEVGVVVYAPYATFIGATLFDQDWGVEIRIVNLTGLEAEQCDWVKGIYDSPGPEVVGRILATTHNSARMCPDCVLIAAIDNSAGTDAIVVKEDIKNWNEVFQHGAVGTGYCSVSEYFFKTFAWAMGVSNIHWIPADDAEPALNEWLTNPTIKSVVLWEPYVSEALEKMPGSWIALSTEKWSGIWDVVAMAKKDYNQAIRNALGAYFQFLKLEMTDQDQAWEILAKWASENPENGALGYGSEEKEYFFTDLAGAAQATLRDNIQLFLIDPGILTLRMEEAAEVLAQYPCLDDNGNPISVVVIEPSTMLDSRYIQGLKEEGILETTAKPINVRISLNQAAPLEGELSKEAERVIGRTADVFIEFLPDSTDFKFPREAEAVIEKTFVRLLRLSKDTVLELVGGYAMPYGCMEFTDGKWQPCTDKVGRELAFKRAKKVRNMIVQLYGVPENRVRLADQVREPAYRDTRDVSLMSQDRRVEGHVIFVAGR